MYTIIVHTMVLHHSLTERYSLKHIYYNIIPIIHYLCVDHQFELHFKSIFNPILMRKISLVSGRKTEEIVFFKVSI